MTDPRKQQLTITLRVEEWDAIALFEDHEHTRLSAYAERLNGPTRHKIGELVGDPSGRFQLAKAEADEQRADIIGNQPAIRRAIRAYVTWWKKGNFEGVSHLGAGCPVDETKHAEPAPGLYLSMTPAGVLVFSLRKFAFAGRYPYFQLTRNEAECLLVLCEKAAPVSSSWNGEGYYNMSVSFGTIR